MKALLFLFLLAPINATASSTAPGNSIKPRGAEAASDCASHIYEVRWLAKQVTTQKAEEMKRENRYSSRLTTLLHDLRGDLRYNAAFLRTNPEEENGWTLYETYEPGKKQEVHDIFRKIKSGVTWHHRDGKAQAWIDTRYGTADFPAAEVAKICPECVAKKKSFRVAIYSVHPNGKLDFWTLDQKGKLRHLRNACKN